MNLTTRFCLLLTLLPSSVVSLPEQSVGDERADNRLSSDRASSEVFVVMERSMARAGSLA
jgi:hypothetical protein